jgi:hypothetical protein
VSSFEGVIGTENSSLGADEVSLYHRMFSFCRAAIHRFYCAGLLEWEKLREFMAVLNIIIEVNWIGLKKKK